MKTIHFAVRLDRKSVLFVIFYVLDLVLVLRTKLLLLNGDIAMWLICVNSIHLFQLPWVMQKITIHLEMDWNEIERKLWYRPQSNWIFKLTRISRIATCHLQLKVGSIIKMLRDINQSRPCNGTWVCSEELKTFVYTLPIFSKRSQIHWNLDKTSSIGLAS